MISETLNLWDNGAVTLPKEWRERYGTKHFLAKEDSNGYLVIMPIIDVEYYERDNGECGLKFPHGIQPEALAEYWGESMKILEKEESKNKASKSRKK